MKILNWGLLGLLALSCLTSIGFYICGPDNPSKAICILMSAGEIVSIMFVFFAVVTLLVFGIIGGLRLVYEKTDGRGIVFPNKVREFGDFLDENKMALLSIIGILMLLAVGILNSIGNCK